MAFSQSECTCLNIQNVLLLYNHADSVNPKFGQSGVYQNSHFKTLLLYTVGGVAQMVERSLSMREVRGSIPRTSKIFTVSGSFS